MLYHFSEDPSIETFHPHVAATSAQDEAYVWAIDEAHLPLYWFPRQCPRVSFWIGSNSPPDAVAWYRTQTEAPRVHCAESAWFERVRAARVFVYTFDPSPFTLLDVNAGHWVSTSTVVPLDVQPVGDLLARHTACGDEFRFVPSLWPLADHVRVSGLAFSMTRLRNAAARPAR